MKRGGLHINSKYVLDSVDLSIIRCVSTNGRLTYVEIASQIGVSEGTVRNHIQRMVDGGVLHFIGVVDPFRTGLYTLALIGLKVEVRYLDSLCQTLQAYKEVRFVVACSGTFNVMLEVAVANTEDLYQFISQELPSHPGIERIEVSQELKLYKNVARYF